MPYPYPYYDFNKGDVGRNVTVEIEGYYYDGVCTGVREDGLFVRVTFANFWNNFFYTGWQPSFKVFRVLPATPANISMLRTIDSSLNCHE